ncbi:MAG: hypothetical protein CV087_23105, partial [Candidatus Brocadia sp. WS118]
MKYTIKTWSLLILPLLLLATLLVNWKSQDATYSEKSYALFFAVNRYDSFPDLKSPYVDAQNIAQELRDKYNFETEVIDNPTIEEMEKAIEKYKEFFRSDSEAANGQFMIYFTGHGTIENDHGFFLATNSNPKLVHRSSFQYDYWRSVIDKINCKHILVVIDACFAGSFDPSLRNRTSGRFERIGEKDRKEKMIENYKKHIARIVFTSSYLEETPDKSDFAKMFLKALREGGGEDRILTSTELFTFLETANPKPHCGDFGQDEPGACFLFFNNEEKSSGPDELESGIWTMAQEQNSRAGCEFYLSSYPEGFFRAEAEQLLLSLNLKRERIVHVKIGGTGDGSSWGNAMGDLHEALKIAGPGTEIWLASGKYLTTPTDDRTISFVIPDSVRLYGGFTGKEDSLGQREPLKNLTILSGEIGQPSKDDNAYTVIYTKNV